MGSISAADDLKQLQVGGFIERGQQLALGAFLAVGPQPAHQLGQHGAVQALRLGVGTPAPAAGSPGCRC